MSYQSLTTRVDSGKSFYKMNENIGAGDSQKSPRFLIQTSTYVDFAGLSGSSPGPVRVQEAWDLARGYAVCQLDG